MEDKRISDNLSIEFHSIFRDLLRNIWVIICAALIGLMVVFIAQHSKYVPEYTSSATLVVNSKMGNTTSSTNVSVSSKLAGVFAEIFVQPTMKSKAAKYAGEKSFSGTVETRVLDSTNILFLSVTSTSPERSYRLLCAILAVYPEISDNIFTNAVIDIIGMPSMPTSASNKMPDKNKTLIVFGTTFVVFLILVFLSVLRDTVKDVSSFKNKIDAKLIGTIPHEKKRQKISDIFRGKKKALLINESVFLSLTFSESFHKIATKIEYLNHKNGDKVFAITSVAENEGKSTIASNIAISLANRGNKVLLLDLDQKKPAIYKIFDLKADEISEFSDMLSGKVSTDEYSFARYKKTKLFIAANTRSHSGHQKYFENGAVKKMIDALKSKVDYIIIDTAPVSVDSGVTSLVKVVDKTIMAVRTDIVQTSIINESILTLNEVGADFAGCILNDARNEFSFFGQAGFDETGYYTKRYGRYGKYGKYGKYGRYSRYSNYSRYGNYSNYSRYSVFSDIPTRGDSSAVPDLINDEDGGEDR